MRGVGLRGDEKDSSGGNLECCTGSALGDGASFTMMEDLTSAVQVSGLAVKVTALAVPGLVVEAEETWPKSMAEAVSVTMVLALRPLLP